MVKKTSETPAKAGRLQQIKQVYRMAKTEDTKILLWLILAFCAVLLAAIAVGIVLHNIPTAALIGIPLAALAALIILSRKAEKGAFKQISGQPGASGAILSNLKRNWINEETPVVVDPRTRDVVFRTIGRPGVVLLSEGAPHRAQRLLNKEKQKIQRIVPNVPVHIIQTGEAEGQTPLIHTTKKIMKLKKKLTAAEVTAVSQRLGSLNNQGAAIPKGVDPTNARINRKATRGY